MQTEPTSSIVELPSNRIGPTNPDLAPLIFGSFDDLHDFIKSFNALNNEGGSV